MRIIDCFDVISYSKNFSEPAKKFTPKYGHLMKVVGPASIDLDTITKTKLTSEEKDKLCKSRACFYCCEEGHIAAICSKKTKMITKTVTPIIKKEVLLLITAGQIPLLVKKL